MIPSLNSWNCEFSPPSLQAWIYAVSVHGVCCILGALPLGSILFYTTTNWKNSNRHRRRIVAVIIAVYAALIVPVTQSTIEDYAPNEKIRFAGSFLSSTFGFSAFFKSINAGFDQYPLGVDANIKTWLLWYINLPEPEFAKGKMCLASKSYVWNKIKLISYKVAGMFIVLTVLKILGDEAEEGPNGWWFVMMHVNGFLHLWLLYLFASFCLDFSSLAVATSGGYRTEPGFLNPLLQSRCYKETWGTRWNCPVQLLLKRTVYIPARKCGFGGSTSAFLTFFASGLLHEYNFSIHSRRSWEPYKATFFFLLMGMMMILEKFVWKTLVPSQLQHAANHLPSPVISMMLTALVSGVFEYYFAQSWVNSGWIDSVGEMLPSLSCKL